MPDFFHDWRRKAGCVTLVMAISLGVECVGYIQDGSLDMICPTDWAYLRHLAILPLTLISGCLLLCPVKRQSKITPPKESLS